MFPSARWKAYLQKIRDNDAEDSDTQNAILHIYHSQDIWFARERKDNHHQESAKENLEKSDALLKDCSTQIDALEATLARTPKPSEMLDWRSLW